MTGLCGRTVDKNAGGGGGGLTTVTGNTPFVWDASDARTKINVVMLDSTTALLTYQIGGSNNGLAQVLDISGTTITGNTPFTFANVAHQEPSVSVIDSSTVIVAYRDNNVDDGVAQILDISGGTVTGNTPFVFDGNFVGSTDVQILTSAKAIVCYKPQGNSRGTSQILDISGGTITGNTPFEFKTASTDEVSIGFISSTQVIVVYRSSNNQAQILDISGGTITGNSELQFDTFAAQGFNIDMVDSTNAVVIYGDGNTCGPRIQKLSISGTTITKHNGTTNEGMLIQPTGGGIGGDEYIGHSIAVLADDTVGVMYRSVNTENLLGVMLLSPDASNVYRGNAPFVVTGSGDRSTSMAKISDTQAIIAYANNGASDSIAQIVDFA